MNPPLERINASKNAFDAGPKLCVCSISAVGENSGAIYEYKQRLPETQFSIAGSLGSCGRREGRTVREAMVAVGKKGKSLNRYIYFCGCL